jgi:hypothetical protein
MSKRDKSMADTYVLDDEVLDEMENFDETGVLEDSYLGRLARDSDTDNEGGSGPDSETSELLDDIYTSTVILD